MPPFIQIMRPKQWIKSGFVLTPYLFSLQFDDLEKLKLSIIATLSFIFISSALYIFNDFLDLQEDRKHPLKKKRPLASGKISNRQAEILILVLLSLGYATTLLLPVKCFFVIMVYMLMNVAYSKKLKHIAIIDVLVIASGFVLRVLMGGYAIDVRISTWLILATFLLALFLGFGKRRHELGLGSGSETRLSLRGYNEEFTDKLINVTCATALVCYAIYAVGIVEKTGKDSFIYTVIFVVFGLFRYLQNIYLIKEGGEPEKILYKDKLFLANIVLWLITTLIILTS